MAEGVLDPFQGQPKIGDQFAPFFTVRFLAPTTTPAQQAGAGAPSGAVAQVNGDIVVSSGDTTIQFSEDARTTQFRSMTTRLTITNMGGGANTMELVMEPPFYDGVKIIDQQLIQWNSIVAVEWGWASNYAQDRIVSDTHFFIIQQPRIEMQNKEITITITGIDMFAYSATKREDRRVYPRSVFSTDALILAALALKNNFRLNFTLTTEASLIRTTKPLSATEPSFIEQNEKDWIFFGRLCDMNNCSFFTIGNTIFIVDQNIAKVQNTTYRLLMFQQPTDSRDILMMSFSTQALPTLFQPAESKEAQVTHFDHDGKQHVTNTYEPTKMPDQQFVGPRTGAGKDEADGRTIPVSSTVQLIPNPAYLPTETGKHFSVPEQKANRDEHAKRVVRDATTIANTNAEATIPGVPHIVPQQLVRVEGVSKTFSGVYMVLKVVHRLDAQGYETDLSLIRDSSTGDEVAGKGEKPSTGGSDPEQAPGGQAVQPTVAENPTRPPTASPPK